MSTTLNAPYYAKWVVGTVIEQLAYAKREGMNKKNCYKNNFLSKGKLKCRNYAGLAMSQVTNKVKNKLKRPKII